MIDFHKKENLALFGVNFSLFLFFSFFLSVRGAYSLAMGLTLLTAISALFLCKNFSINKETKLLSVFLLILSVFWSHSFDGWATWSGEGDYFIKYALGALCALVIGSLTASPRILVLSMALGCITSAMLALYQFPSLGRSEGYTNAIKFGDIAIYMGIACLILAAARSWSQIQRLLLAFAGAMGVIASLLSLSRGGWILLACLPLLAMYFVSMHYRKRWFAALCVATTLLTVGGSQIPALQQRMVLAEQEVTGYFMDPQKYVPTSIGARLEQWRLSWALGAIKPVSGWGEKGYYVGKEELIAAGGFHPFLREIHHSHNDFLDMWAKRGIFGVIVLLAIYIVPIAVFYPTRERIAAIEESERSLFVAISLVGVMISVGYFVFGWTDVFFNLSIGHNFFIFSLIFILATVNRMRKHQSVNFLEQKV